VYEIRARNLGPDHIDAIRTRINIGTVTMLTGDDEGALKIYRELEPRLIKARGTDHPDVLALMRNEGIAHGKLKHTREAEALFDSTLAISRRMYGNDHPQTATALSDLGQALMDLKRFDEAHADLAAAFDIFLAKLGASDPHTVMTAKLLVQLAKKMGDDEMVAKYEKYTGQ
jgi:tetratricopeptide (TPR) repeat protein